MRLTAMHIGVSALALMSAPALAQTPPADPGASTEQAESPSTDQGEIIVTARRRNENLQTTPLSGSVLSGTDLAEQGRRQRRRAAVRDAQRSSSTTSARASTSTSAASARASTTPRPRPASSPIATARRPSPAISSGEPYYDVANIQVLRGPQGTIVGQNATGGAVFVNTQRSDHRRRRTPATSTPTSATIREFGAQGAVNLPVGDTFAARVALFGHAPRRLLQHHRPGRREVYRQQRRPAPDRRPDQPAVEADAAADDPVEDRPRLPRHGRLLGDAVPQLLPTSRSARARRTRRYSDLFDVQLNSPQEARDKFYRSILRVNYEFDSGIQLRSVSGYSRGNTKYRADLDGTALLTPATADRTFFDNVNERQFSQELTLISPDTARVSYLLGAFGAVEQVQLPAAVPVRQRQFLGARARPANTACRAPTPTARSPSSVRSASRSRRR